VPVAAAHLPAPATASRTAKRLGRYCSRMAHTASAQAPCLNCLVLPLLQLRSSPAAAPAAVLAAGQPSHALPAADRRGSGSEQASSCRPTHSAYRFNEQSCDMGYPMPRQGLGWTSQRCVWEAMLSRTVNRTSNLAAGVQRHSTQGISRAVGCWIAASCTCLRALPVPEQG